MGKKNIVSEAVNEFHNAGDKFKNIAKKEITATVKGTDMFEFNGKWVNVAQLIKTSEDLTDENLNLISELDKYNQLINIIPKSTIGPIRFFKADENQQTELEYIKSTRLYKLFKWLGVW